MRCASSRYQQALFRIVEAKLAAAAATAAGANAAQQQRQGVAVTNSVMELRNICNHPTIRCTGCEVSNSLKSRFLYGRHQYCIDDRTALPVDLSVQRYHFIAPWCPYSMHFISCY